MIQKLKVFREKFTEKFEETHEKLRAQWMSFSPREKMVVSIMAGVMGLLVCALIIKEGATLVSRVSSQSERNLENIEKIQVLLRDLSAQKADLMKYERLRGKRGETFDLQKFLVEEATRYGANLEKSLPTRALSPDGKEIKNEDWVEVTLKDASLDATLKFLSSIEDTLGLKVMELKMKPQFADPTKFEVVTLISSARNL